MYSEYNTPDKQYLLKTDKYICNKFGLAEFFARYYGEFGNSKGEYVLDAGCGAMPMGIFLANQFQCKVTGVELNPIACKCAEYNIEKLNVKCQVNVINDNFVTFAAKYSGEKFDLIVANPPVDNNVPSEYIIKYADYNFEILDDKSFAFLTNSWHSADGKDLIDYIFEFGQRYLNPEGQIILVFCTIDCGSPDYVYEKAYMYAYKIFKIVEGYISAESVGAESLGLDKLSTFMVGFRREGTVLPICRKVYTRRSVRPRSAGTRS